MCLVLRECFVIGMEILGIRDIKSPLGSSNKFSFEQICIHWKVLVIYFITNVSKNTDSLMGMKVILLIHVCLIIKWLILSSCISFFFLFSCTSFLSVKFLFVAFLLNSLAFSNWFMWLYITRLLFLPECTAITFTCVFFFWIYFLGFRGDRVWKQVFNCNVAHLSIPSVMVCAPQMIFINPRVTSIRGIRHFAFTFETNPSWNLLLPWCEAEIQIHFSIPE